LVDRFGYIISEQSYEEADLDKAYRMW
jgi:hypothetical protein